MQIGRLLAAGRNFTGHSLVTPLRGAVPSAARRLPISPRIPSPDDHPICLPANWRRHYSYATDSDRPAGSVELDADPAVELDVGRDVMDSRPPAHHVRLHLRWHGGNGGAQGDPAAAPGRRTPGQHVGHDDLPLQHPFPVRTRLLPDRTADVVVGRWPDGLVLLGGYGAICIRADRLDRERYPGVLPAALERHQSRVELPLCNPRLDLTPVLQARGAMARVPVADPVVGHRGDHLYVHVAPDHERAARRSHRF